VTVTDGFVTCDLGGGAGGGRALVVQPQNHAAELAAGHYNLREPRRVPADRAHADAARRHAHLHVRGDEERGAAARGRK